MNDNEALHYRLTADPEHVAEMQQHLNPNRAPVATKPVYRDLCTVLSPEQRNEMLRNLAASALRIGVRPVNPTNLTIGASVLIRSLDNATGKIIRIRKDDRGDAIYTVETTATLDGLFYARHFELAQKVQP